MTLTIAGRAWRLLESERHVQLRALGELEPRWHDANDRSGAIVDDHAAADDAGIAPKAPLPETMREDDD